MKSLTPMLAVLGLVMACNVPATETTHELTPTEKIARAYGIDKFDNMGELDYTFNVQRDTILSGRSWRWRPSSGEVVSISNGDTVSYNNANVGEDLKQVDHRFINDKYWLLFPFQLVWDSDMSFKLTEKQEAPISGKPMNHLVVTYGSEGGYTPGDVYELFLDDNWLIREWVFRKGGSEEPSLVTTWENYKDFDGIKIALDHYSKDRGFRLFFTNVKCIPKS